MCVDDDLKNVAGGLHTPIDNNDQKSENEFVKEDDNAEISEQH